MQVAAAREISMTSFPVQQSQAETYNHPCGDLLQRGRRREYLNICVPLYKALIERQWESAMAIFQRYREYHLVGYSITEYKETPLHIVAAAPLNLNTMTRRLLVNWFPSVKTLEEMKTRTKRLEIVRHLVNMMEKEDLKLQNEDGNTALCISALAGDVEMAKIMVDKTPEVLTIRGSNNMMPLVLAASYGNHKMVKYLYNKQSQQMSSDAWTDDERDMVFLKCIETDIFDVALKILDDNIHKLQFSQKKHLRDALNILARKTVISRMLSQPISGLFTLVQQKRSATQLLTKIWDEIVELPKDEIDALLKGPPKIIILKDDGTKTETDPKTKDNGTEAETYPSQILFVAAEKGNINFLNVLFDKYPDLALKTNDDGRTIFHIAALHQHRGIVSLLYKMDSMKDRVVQLIDKDGNNMLHLAAMKEERKQHDSSWGAMIQMQHDLYRFHEVKAMMPRGFIDMKNKKDQTPTQVFSEEHQNLLSDAQTWTKETLTQCIVVAALIATIGFSAAFTFPGGYHQDTGFPMFLENRSFMVFVVMDAISFFLSSCSLLIFLLLIFSNYSRSDLRVVVPTLIITGFSALFVSIVCSMAAVCASFFILYDNKLAIAISCFAYLPLCILVIFAIPLYEYIDALMG